MAFPAILFSDVIVPGTTGTVCCEISELTVAGGTSCTIGIASFTLAGTFDTVLRSLGIKIKILNIVTLYKLLNIFRQGIRLFE